MSITISPLASANIAYTGGSTVNALSGVAPSIGLPPLTTQVRPQGVTSTSTSQAASLNRTGAEKLISSSLTAGNAILQGLIALKSAVQTAGDTALTSPYTNLLIGGDTRLSVVNINAQLGQFVTAINQIVKNSAVAGVNLISSSGTPVTLQTTSHGGSIRVAPQPLDAQGLGLTGLNLHANGGINRALGQISSAIATATQRVSNLNSLQQYLDGATVGSQLLTVVTGKYGATALPRGSLVNLTA